MNLPSAFEEKMRGLLQEEFDEYIACYEEPRYYGLRVNTAKITVEEFERICPFEITPIPWIENGFYYDGENVAPAKHPYYFAGLYYLQEPSAMTPASRLPVEPGDKVLDVCAAPGGKSFSAAFAMEDQGEILACDLHENKLKRIREGAERLGLACIQTTAADGRGFRPEWEAAFDVVLVDAPCSGFGIIRKKPDVRYKKPDDLFALPVIQRAILDNAARYEARRHAGVLHLHDPAGGERGCIRQLPGRAPGLLPHALLPVRTGGGDRGPGDSVAPPPRHRRLLHLPHDAELRNDP